MSPFGTTDQFYHAATNDYFDNNSIRTGVRTVGIGERPYFDDNGKSREQDLKETNETV